MISRKNFGIIGGDMRQYFLSKSLKNDENIVSVVGLEKIDTQSTFHYDYDFKNLSDNCDYIILPVPISRDGKKLNAPLSQKEINLDLNFWNSLKNKKVFGGIISSVEDKVKNLCFYDYYREDFMILNALPTAEGAILITLKECNKNIKQSNCLIVGYGRIGKILANLLKNMGANVTISARKNEDLTWAQTIGYSAFNIKASKTPLEFDVIFNTVPSLIFDKNTLSRCNSKTLIIDLASSPGGVDTESSKKMGIKSIHALGIPGKYFPETAGEIIKKIIYKIIEEENL